jgi:hypothetical protein
MYEATCDHCGKTLLAMPTYADAEKGLFFWENESD